ncbi:MAG TPA: pyridoxamine 5'-phosphate oxidase [Thermoanaerobaculia bacterium]|nr:pyridoxamine 5'-phosphate oxidase [Thermoanaerobaculia bacterium]
MNVADIRREYERTGLSEEDLAPDPVEQFGRWLHQAMEVDPQEFTAMTLATADREGRPSARIVLLKGYDERGFVFYTNYESRKGRELDENPRAALVFYWASLDRQVRIEGTVEKTTREESEAYFCSRPVGARIGAWASRQSHVLPRREDLERTVREIEERFGGGEVPLPDSWGGYRVVPELFEFWQGRTSRLHDRLCYVRLPEGGWRTERLSP